MRLGFSVAAHIQADVLLLDEVFAVGDEEFQRKCFGKIHEFKNRGGTIVFVSHDAQAVERLCDRAVLLRQGDGRVRRPDARGDRRVPAAPRGRSSARRARGGAARMGKRRGADRLRPGCSTPTAERRPVRVGRGGRRRARDRVRARRSPRRSSRSSCATTPGSCSAALTAADGRARLGERPRRAGAPLRDRPAAARRRPLPPPLRPDRERRAAGCSTRSTTPPTSSSSRPGPRRARCCSRAAGRCRRSRRLRQSVER